MADGGFGSGSCCCGRVSRLGTGTPVCEKWAVRLAGRPGLPGGTGLCGRRRGREPAPHFGVELPMLNHIAVNYLLEQGFRMDPFTAVFMWDKPLGNPANYICTSPPFFR